MGYDFTFVRLRDHKRRSFPVSFDDVRLGEEDFARLESVGDGWQQLREFPGMIPNGSHGKCWDVPEGGSLYVNATEYGFDIDTHASWEAVLELYVYLKGFYPDLVVLDPQAGAIFDEESFRRFVEAPDEIVPRRVEEKKAPDPAPLKRPERSFVEAVLDLNRTNPTTRERVTEICRAARCDLRAYRALGEKCLWDFVDAFGHESHSVRSSAFHAVGALGPKARDAVPALIEALEQPHLQMYAASAIRELGVTARAAIPKLIEVLDSAFDAGREFGGDPGTVLLAVEKLGPSAEEAAPAAARYLNHPEARLRVFAGRALIGVGKPEPFVAVATQLLRETCQDYSTGWHAAVTRLMGRLGEAAKPLVEELGGMLADEDPLVRLSAAMAFEEIGEHAAHQVSSLIGALSDPSGRVRRRVIRCPSENWGRGDARHSRSPSLSGRYGSGGPAAGATSPRGNSRKTIESPSENAEVVRGTSFADAPNVGREYGRLPAARVGNVVGLGVGEVPRLLAFAIEDKERTTRSDDRVHAPENRRILMFAIDTCRERYVQRTEI